MADVDSCDRIICHACDHVWPRSQHGLDCPHCGSDFTEIIEIPPDTDPEPEPPHPDPPEAYPGHRSPSPPPVNPWTDHNPWAHLDDDDDTHGWDTGPRVVHRSFQSPNGAYTFHGTIRTHGLPPRRVPGARGEAAIDPMMQGLESFFQSINGLDRERAARTQPRSPRPPDAAFGLPPPRATYHQPPGGLFPRDADGPQPMNSPLRSLGDILELLQTNVGQPQPGGPNVRIVAGGTPLALISALLNMGRNGDAVYSQEELDRVISQLVEQNGNHSAVPPAAEDAIQALPKKPADAEILGHEGKAECSICMDSVKVGDEVTVLPCTHWFHPQCIEMWLNQHNTCPHCRRGIDPTASDATTTAPSEGTSERTRRSHSLSGSSAYQSYTSDEDQRSRHSRGEGSGGWAGWVRSRLGGGS
ncbi:putative RING finger domain protein [Aspergillus lucknowensis]|uniref:RING-type domain-containing protein n=1 Tax=Aspergillus lucknowensis TaxID=176173 RepID=A0ABR4M8D0_9EURO